MWNLKENIPLFTVSYIVALIVGAAIMVGCSAEDDQFHTGLNRQAASETAQAALVHRHLNIADWKALGAFVTPYGAHQAWRFEFDTEDGGMCAFVWQISYQKYSTVEPCTPRLVAAQ